MVAVATKAEPSQIVVGESLGKRGDSIATGPREYYLSAPNEDYLKELAQDIGKTDGSHRPAAARQARQGAT